MEHDLKQLLEHQAELHRILVKSHEALVPKLEQLLIRERERTDEFIRFGLMLVPLLLGQIGSDGKPGGNSPRDAAVGRFLKELTEVQFMAILQALPPEKKLTLLELYKSYAADERSGRERTDGEPGGGEPKSS